MPNPSFRRTLLIGLGGAGQLIVTSVKRSFLDTHGSVPPSVRLLCLDTDNAPVRVRSRVSEREYGLDPEEFLHISVDQPQSFVEQDPEVKKWFIHPLPVGAITKGAGQIRQNGRVAFFFNLNRILPLIESLVKALTSGGLRTRMDAAGFNLSDQAPEVYVCGSLAGGTGSGTFLDTGILLRHMLDKALIHGFFLLDWIYRPKPYAHRVSSNVYAALSELDYVQSVMFDPGGAKRQARYRMRYGPKDVGVTEPPYSLFHLIDGRNEHGENIGELGELCEAIAEAIFLSVGAMGHQVGSVTDNLLGYINTSNASDWHGQNPRYSSFGVSSIFYPAKELHRLVAAEAAARLCQQAIAEAEGIRDETQRQQHAKTIENDVSNAELYPSRETVREKVCPFPLGNISFQVPKFMMSDKQFPEQVNGYCDGQEKQLLDTVDEVYKDHGPRATEDTKEKFKLHIRSIENRPAEYRRLWAERFADLYKARGEEAARDADEALQEAAQLRESAKALLGQAKDAWIVFGRGPRVDAVAHFEQETQKRLEALARQKICEHEKAFHQDLEAVLRAGGPTRVPLQAEIVHALQETAGVLRSRAAAEHGDFKRLRAKTTTIVVGDGSVIVPGQAAGVPRESLLDLPYDAFKQEQKIRHPEDYLEKFRKDPKDLVKLFSAYCHDKYKHLADVGVDEAMDVVGRARGDRDLYIERQFDDLFRLSSALWTFNKGELSVTQSEHYQKIVNLGVRDQAEGAAGYGRVVQDVKSRYNITKDHTFSTTHDPNRIWLLNYAASLPVYFLNDLRQAKEKYEKAITPSYHVDRELEMNVPDLFPTDGIDNVALRVLGMAIIPVIDVIQDEKLIRGHKFTCHAEKVKATNFGEPKVWYLPPGESSTSFQQMYQEVALSYNPATDDDLLDILIALLKERVGALPQDQLRKAIDAHIKKLQDKLARRDFTKLLSARLTYRELQALRQFLDPRGYAMNIDRYIAGN